VGLTVASAQCRRAWPDGLPLDQDKTSLVLAGRAFPRLVSEALIPEQRDNGDLFLRLDGQALTFQLTPTTGCCRSGLYLSTDIQLRPTVSPTSATASRPMGGTASIPANQPRCSTTSVYDLERCLRRRFGVSTWQAGVTALSLKADFHLQRRPGSALNFGVSTVSTSSRRAALDPQSIFRPLNLQSQRNGRYARPRRTLTVALGPVRAGVIDFPRRGPPSSTTPAPTD
jgi:hypothetical protein